MKKNVILLCAMFIGLTAHAQEFKGDFTKIDASFMYDIELVKADDCSVKVDCPEELQQYIIVEIRNETLTLSNKDAENFKKRLKKIQNSKDRIKVYVTMPKLDELEMDGMCQLTSEGVFTTDNFAMDVSGMSKVENLSISSKDATLEVHGMSSAEIDIEGGNLKVEVFGMAKMEVKGSAEYIDLDVAGMSSFNGSELTSNRGKVDVSGMSSGTTKIKNITSIDVSGMSSFKNNY